MRKVIKVSRLVFVALCVSGCHFGEFLIGGET